jgi:hypothetical protein
VHDHIKTFLHNHLIQNPVLKDVDHIKIQYEIAGLLKRDRQRAEEVKEIVPVKIAPRVNYVSND